MALNYGHLRYFWAVAHEGGLNKAAQRLNVSQSALSVQIAQLEAQLGQQLFERRGRTLTLTEAGRIALDHADSIFAAGDELVSTLKGAMSTSRHRLRVGALTTLSRNFQMRFLRPVAGRRNVEVIVRAGDLRTLVGLLESLELDVVLATAPPPREGGSTWVAHRIAEQPVSLVGLPRYAGSRRAKRPPDLQALLALAPLVLPAGDSNVRAGFDAYAERAGLTFDIAAEVEDMALLRLLAREGVGMAVAPPIVFNDELESGLLTELVRFPELTETFYAITQKRRYPNPLLRDLIADPEL